MPAIAIRCTAHVLVITAVLTLVSAATFAQSQPQNKPTTPTTTTGNPLGAKVPLAPVGHRQPRAADVGQVERTPAEIQEDRLQAELERKMRICRGC